MYLWLLALLQYATLILEEFDACFILVIKCKTTIMVVHYSAYQACRNNFGNFDTRCNFGIIVEELGNDQEIIKLSTHLGMWQQVTK